MPCAARTGAPRPGSPHKALGLPAACEGTSFKICSSDGVFLPQGDKRQPHPNATVLHALRAAGQVQSEPQNPTPQLWAVRLAYTVGSLAATATSCQPGTPIMAQNRAVSSVLSGPGQHGWRPGGDGGCGGRCSWRILSCQSVSRHLEPQLRERELGIQTLGVVPGVVHSLAFFHRPGPGKSRKTGFSLLVNTLLRSSTIMSESL